MSCATGAHDALEKQAEPWEVWAACMDTAICVGREGASRTVTPG